MNEFPENLLAKIQKREHENALRSMDIRYSKVDFSSNDYLGFSKLELAEGQLTLPNGSTGSRLLTGNHHCHQELEAFLSEFHQAESALVFNSGYDANLGFFSAVPQRGDIVIYDSLVHASIRDGIKLGNAKSYKFKHNDLEDLKKVIYAHRNYQNNIYVVSESVFSMDGDSPDLNQMVRIVKKAGAYLVIDEAHALGVFGYNGEGLVQSLGLQEDVFARIITFGKALGCHGAAVLGSEMLKTYLINFARSFMYTTSLSPHSISVIQSSYDILSSDEFPSHFKKEQKSLHNNIEYFKSELSRLGLNDRNYIESNSAIQCIIIPGNNRVKAMSLSLKVYGFDVRPIMSPTVPKGYERIRFCLHSFNTFDQITNVLTLLI